jgi:cytochrome c oxidase subunit 2
MPSFSLFPERASTIAGQVDSLFFFMIGVSLFFGLLVAILVVYLSLRYRRRAGNDDVGAEIHGNLRLEILWTGIPLVIAMGMFFWGASVYVTMARPPDDAHEIFVVGKQWMWKLQHLEGRREINELHVPVGQPVKLTMTSEDVIHSFYVPAFRIKADAVPGRYNTAWFEATKVGTYHLFCAEYCGTQHSQMIGKIVVMERADFQDWLSGQAGASQRAAAGDGGSPVDVGEALFAQKGCVTCHKTGAGVMGPSLVGLYGKRVSFADGSSAVADDDYLRSSILAPQAHIVAGFQPIMPTFKGQIDEEGILALIQYIKSLSAADEPSESGQG